LVAAVGGAFNVPLASIACSIVLVAGIYKVQGYKVTIVWAAITTREDL
jgi:hypothetical protein